MNYTAFGSVLVTIAIVTSFAAAKPRGNLSSFLSLTHAKRANTRVPRSVFNELIVKERAWRLSCKRRNCTVLPECRNPRGWSLWGSDTGCCGNYEGCCNLASVYCWVHDIFCRCCDYGVFICGPLCTKEPDCPPDEEETGSGELHLITHNKTIVENMRDGDVTIS